MISPVPRMSVLIDREGKITPAFDTWLREVVQAIDVPKPLTFATLPTPSAGMTAYVTDSSTATWGATITGGGANEVLAFYNGTNWTVAAV